MRTPPTKFLTDFDLGYSLFYLLKVVSDTNTYYWHTAKETFSLWPNLTSDHGGAALTKDGTQISQRINGEEVPGIGIVETGLNIDYGSGLGEIGDFQFTLLNQDEISDTINSQNFLNRAVELRVGFVDTVNGTGVNDMLLVGNYVIDTIEPVDFGRLSFKCVDGTFLRDKELPVEVITKETHPYAPTESIGRVLPYVYGDFYTLNNILVGGAFETALFWRHFGVIDAVPTIRTTTATGIGTVPQFTIAGHKCKSIDANNKYFAKNKLLGLLIPSSTTVTELNTATISGFSLGNIFQVSYVMIPQPTRPDKITAIETTGNQFLRAIDKSIDTSYLITGNGTYPALSPAPTYLHYVLSETGDGTLLAANNIELFVVYGSISAGMILKVGARDQDTLGYIEGAITASQVVNNTSAYGVRRLLFTGGLDAVTWQTLREDWEYGFAAWAGEAQIRHICLEAVSLVASDNARDSDIAVYTHRRHLPAGYHPSYTVSLPTFGPAGNRVMKQDIDSAWFASVKGRMFGSWVDDARTNDYNEDDLIEAPEFVIESILRDGLGLASTAINTTSFDAARNLLTGRNKCAFSWFQQRLAFDQIRNLAEDFGLVVTTDYNNKVRIVVPSFYSTHDFRLTANDLLGNDALKIYRTSPDLIFNDFTLNYNFNYADNSFEDTLSLNADLSELSNIAPRNSGFRDGFGNYVLMLQASETKYVREKRKFSYDAMHIKDYETAFNCIRFLTDWLALQRYILEIDVPFKKLESSASMTTADIEVGDFCLVNHSLLPLQTSSITGTSGLSDEALFIVTRVVFNPQTLTFHYTLRETPYRSQPTEQELGADPGGGYGTGYAESYGDQL